MRVSEGVFAVDNAGDGVLCSKRNILKTLGEENAQLSTKPQSGGIEQSLGKEMFALKVVGQYWGMTQFDVFEATFKAEKWNVKED